MADLTSQMFLGRMAYRLSLLCLAISTVSPALVAAVETANVTPEILNFVPVCAQTCFQSFIGANFDASVCGNAPSLQCLCRQKGSSGYTVGEGAASCLAGESRFGACQGQDGISEWTFLTWGLVCCGLPLTQQQAMQPPRRTTCVSASPMPKQGRTRPLWPPLSCLRPAQARCLCQQHSELSPVRERTHGRQRSHPPRPSVSRQETLRALPPPLQHQQPLPPPPPPQPLPQPLQSQPLPKASRRSSPARKLRVSPLVAPLSSSSASC